MLSRIGPIALEEALGAAADSNVLRGIHLERNMTMAVKLLPRHLVNRPMGGDTFATDVKTLQKLVHPGIARIYGGAMDNGQPYLAMELVPGESLRSRLDRLGRLPWETTVDMAHEICQALDFAHKKGVVHQRLNPCRVLLTPEGTVKLIGFDSKFGDRDDVLGLRTPMSVAHYLAPEEFRGRQSASLPPCDLFSLGVIWFEALTGQLPWKSNSAAELVQRRRESPAPRVSSLVLECPVWLDVLIARLLEVKRTDRLPTAEATHRAIVDAKNKLASGMGAVQHAWAGKQGALATGADSKALSKLRKKQVTRERDQSPFYEQAWFLAVCLAAVIGVGVWSLWPKSEATLFAAAKPLMDSDDPVSWNRAETQFLDELLERFPQTEHADEIAAFQDKLAKHRAEQKVQNIERFGREPDSEPLKIYAEAYRHERFGSLNTAWSLYEKLVRTTSTKELEDRAYVNLAKDAIRRVKSKAASDETPFDFVTGKLHEAQELANQGRHAQARNILDELVVLYAHDRQMKPLVDKARSQLKQLDALGAPPSSSQ